ncbi:MAG: hypothetical protein MJ177_00380 [Clostridia bacterium]|nr:hypothetical protein [Clostridia bacterium]
MLIRKIIALFFTVLMLLNCPFTKAETSVPVTVEGAIFGGAAGDSISLQLDFDTRWITLAGNKVYNPRLAAFSALLCADSYYRAKDEAKGTQNRVLIDGEEAYTQAALLEKLGYEDVRFIESFKAKQYAADGNDSATIVLGYKNIDDKFDSYIIVLRGCFSAGERLSIFDVGAQSEAYTALTGAHEEWKNGSYFKGVDIAANRAMEFIKEYMAQHDSEKRPDTALVTGHSRGAVLANVIGAQFEKDNGVKSYTYTFNCMPVTTQKNAVRYKTIYNIFDKNDYYVNPLPFGNESFYRYGTDIGTDISENTDIKKEIAELKGRDDYACLSPEVKAEYDRLFASRFPDRKSLYEFCTLTESFETLQAAEEKRAEFESLTGSAGLNIAAFCKISEIAENGGKYSFSFSYCPAALIFCYAQIQAYGQAVCDAVMTLFEGDEAGCRIAQIIMDNLDGINAGHLLVNGYAVCGR